MAVGSGVPYNAHIGNGVTTVFAYGFTLLDADDLVVTIDGVVTSAYSVSGIGVAAGGSITFSSAPTSGAAVLLQRVIQLVREAEYQNNGDLQADTVNGDFDRIWMAVQGVDSTSRRALRGPLPEEIDELPDAQSRALRLLGFDADGQPTVVAPVSGSAEELALSLASSGAANGAGMVEYNPADAYLAGLGEHLNYTFGRTDGEIAAGVTPTNWAAFPGFPERYGAIGDGVANDQAAVAACFAANEIVRLTDGAFYLINGITITAARKVVYGAGYNSGFIISGSSGSFGLKFIHASGSGTHFGAGFRGFDFRVTCKATSNKIIGIWMDNAEIDGLERVYIDLSSNTHVGTARNATFGMYGYYQQDGVFTKCHFTGGSGAYSDGLYLTGVVTLSAPNNNLFIGCRAQSSAGYGVRNEVGDGNVWLGGKIQSNGLGGWLEGDDGLGNGPSNTVIRYAGFEANSGDDVKAEITNFLYMEHNTFQSTGATNHINIAFGNNCRLEKNFSFPGKPVLISGGTGNYWDRLNAGFGARSFASGTMADAAVQDVTVSGGSPSAVSIDCSVTEYVRLDVTTTANFTVSAPTNPSDCQILTIDITNSTGTASTGTITWPASFGMAGSWVSPANTKRRSLTMRRNGTRWTEIGRSPADI